MKSTIPGIMNIQVQCPVCGSEMETTLAAARAGLKCGQCGTGFVPEKAVRLDMDRALIDDQVNGLATSAVSVSSCAKALAGLGGVVLIGAVIAVLSGSGSGWLVALAVASGLFFWAVLLGILSQLLHIRAAITDRRKG